MNPSRFHIIGAGVAGLCLANELSDRGEKVTLYDCEARAGCQACSWWAGGMLAPFCEGETAEEVIVTYSQKAADWWQNQGVKVTRQGTLVITPRRDQSEITRFGKQTREHKSLTGPEITSLEPDLENRFHKGLFFEGEGHLNPRNALARLEEKLNQNGVKRIVGKAASPPALSRDQRSADVHHIFIDCRGFAAKDQLSDLRGVKGEMLIILCPEIKLHRPIRLLHPRVPIYIVPRDDGVFMLGATMIESSDRDHVTARSLLELLSSAYALHPAFGEAEILEIGVDTRPAFTDNIPRLVQKGTGPSHYFINGLYRHGYSMAPALAVMTCDYLLENKSPDPRLFRKDEE